MNSALFLDRDDTLIADAGYMSSPGQIKLLPGVAEAIEKVRSLIREYEFTTPEKIKYALD